MSLADFVALHDLAVADGVIKPVLFTDLDSVPESNAPEAGAAFYAFARQMATEAEAKAAYRMFATFAA